MSAAVSTGTVTIGAAEWRALCDSVFLLTVTLAAHSVDPNPERYGKLRDAAEDLASTLRAAVESKR